MLARPIRLAAVLVIAACSVSTAAYATDTSPTSTDPSPTSTVSGLLVNTQQDQVISAASNLSDGTPANRQSIIGLGVAQPATISDASLRSSIVVQSLPTFAIIESDVVLARPGTGAKFVAAKWNALTYFWSDAQMSCLNSLWSRESHWNFKSRNSSSGAYGIPQANPGSKMSSAGSDWRTNPITQIKWGMSYVNARYGNPCGALTQSNRLGWY
jgi:hypothetical protein